MHERRVAMLSEHASPLAWLGSEDAGGQNVYVAEVTEHLARLGYRVDVFTRADAEDLPAMVDWQEGVRVIHIPAGPRSFLKKDAIWPHIADFRDGILRFAQRERRRYDLIHANFWMSGWVACELRAALDAPVATIFHALGKIKRLHQGAADTSPDDRIPVEHRVLRESDRIIAQCPAEVTDLLELYGTRVDHVRVIPSAVNVDEFRPIPQLHARTELGLAADEWIAVYVGRMLPRKGIDNAVHALARLAARTSRSVRLVLVGGETADPDPLLTPEIGRLADLATTLGIGDLLTFVGKRPQRQLKLYYSAADVCVTTPWYEPFGLTPLEAMACGTPVIGSAVGGIPYTVADGETGYLVPPKDPAALADRLEVLLRNPELRAAMSRQARHRVVSHFTWARVAERTAALYEEIWRATPRPAAPASPAQQPALPVNWEAQSGVASE